MTMADPRIASIAVPKSENADWTKASVDEAVIFDGDG